MKIKTGLIHDLYVVLAQARCVELSTEEKINVSLAARVLKPIAVTFDGDSADIAEKMKTSEDLFERYQKALQYMQMTKDPLCDMSKLPMGPAENDAFWKEWGEYNRAVDKAMKPIIDKEHELEIKKISEATFQKLVSSNPNWTIGQIDSLGEILVE